MDQKVSELLSAQRTAIEALIGLEGGHPSILDSLKRP